MGDTRLRLQFVKKRRFKKFVKRLKLDDFMGKFVEEYQDNSVLFKFNSPKMREYCLELFKKQIPSSVLKTTTYGHRYLKIMK